MGWPLGFFFSDRTLSIGTKGVFVGTILALFVFLLQGNMIELVHKIRNDIFFILFWRKKVLILND